MWLSAAFPIAAQTSAGEPERWAELADTIFRNYGPDDGLPISTVETLAEDGDGFLWVGMSGGLARWDGYHFSTYRKDPSDPGALRDDFVWCLKSDSLGRLWVGTNNGLSRYDRQTDRFESFAIEPGNEDNVAVRALAPDDAGGMWVGSDKGLRHLDSKGAKVEVLGTGDVPPLNLSAIPILSLLSDRAGGLWVGTASGLMRRSGGAAEFMKVPVQGESPESLAILSLFEAADGRVWVGTRGHGVYEVDSSGQLARPVGDLDRSGLDRSSINSIAEGKPGEIWLSEASKGIVVLDPVTARTRAIRHDSARSSSLPHDLVFSLYRDRSGLMWAGTYTGMGVHNPVQDAVLTIFGGSSHAQGLTGADVITALSASDGTVWVTYLDGGLDVLDPAQHRLAAIGKDKFRSPDDNRVRSIAEGADGYVYLGTLHGLYRSALKGRALSDIQISPELADPAVFALRGDASGVWIGTHGQGVWHLDYAGKSRRYAPNDLAGQWITSFALAGDGRLWVGSYQGLYLLDPNSNQARKVLPSPGVPQTQSDGLVTTLLADRQGRLWVGVRGGGITVIESANANEPSNIRRIGVAEGLADLNIDTLLEDSSGAVWASTASGLIMRVSADLESVVTLRRAEGVSTRSFIWNSGSATPHGELLFGGDGALAVVRPHLITSWNWRPPVVVTDLRVGGRQLAPQSEDGTGPKMPLDILPENNSLAVEFAALDYSSPERNRYAYKLEGFDKDWMPSDSTRRLASYTNLPPGHYTLHLRGSNRDGAWTEKTLDIPVRVLPAWYHTVAFKMALVAAAALGFWFMVRVRTSYLRHRQFILEGQVAQRTAELQQSNSQLEIRTSELDLSLREVAASRAKVADLLDTSGQGFLSFDADLIIEPDFSRACIPMLGLEPQGHKADEVLFPGDAAKAELFREVISGALASDDPFKRDLLLSLLPATTERFGRQLKLEYRRLDNGHLMVVLTDVTEERRLAKRVESERQRLALIVAAVSESRDFFDAVEAFRQFVRQDLMEILAARAEPLSVYQEIYRQIHTFKGMLAQYNFSATPSVLNDLEEKLSELRRKDAEMTTGQIVELVVPIDFRGALETDLTVLRNALGEDFVDQGKRVFLPLSQARRLRAFSERLLAGEALDPGSAELRELFEEFRKLDKIALAEALAAYEHTVSQVSKRLDKEVGPLSIDGGEDLWFDPDQYGSFLRSLVHVFRNAVIHGIEDPDERLAQEKEPVGRIECVIRQQDSSFTLSIADDGAGIDPKALRERAISVGLMSREQADGLSDEEAVELIFADAVSSLRQEGELAGRGVGLSAVRAQTHALGGQVTVTSSLGTGTRFLFTLPFSSGLDRQRPADMTGV